MINFETIFTELEMDIAGNQKKLNVSSALKVFYGINANGNFRLAFLSTISPPKLESTKTLKVSQGQESEKVFWSCFDLINSSAKQVFYSFCNDLVDSISEKTDEYKAFTALKNRFYSWKLMFKKDVSTLSEENTKGLFGELYFLKNYMMTICDISTAIETWSGPDGASKDFSKGLDWFEIKTVAMTSPSVRISSITQLSSTKPGYLTVVRIEKMSEQYEDGQSSIAEIFRSIINEIDSDETKEKFITKLVSYGFDITDDSCKMKLKVYSMNHYKVNDTFPRLLETDIKFQEINKVSYELIINTLEKFKVVI